MHVQYNTAVGFFFLEGGKTEGFKSLKKHDIITIRNTRGFHIFQLLPWVVTEM